ncbi:hypothetical protein A2707_01235 [Candidatus Saccharibacteria bacterium RIFCSPHIGHO2_01_FULL_45_15]|nr:MAG: hypothetical protein A2707_01235 [Candidatus Saccharibacteria bacterium RIFCSPHIGHO2_01_FULL_45_15]OGL26991.1 MAG: hypothetical protein A3C39_02350 [Candidatus Saccharibacteria bacterium RIFCSPHIGHO2_02_FULL_46_12]OGL32904.1 MAG: hypothetical protein A3E76_06090 [Candidatus Saccharibacteria bacterium RIFCSPHIGHO2_12_FULL_44_22]
MNEVLVNAQKIGGINHLSWRGELLKQTNQWIIVHGKPDNEAHHHTRDLKFKFTHEIIGIISRNEYYNLFAAYDSSGIFHHSYCNVATPGVYDQQTSEVSWIDLELDVVFDKDGNATLLDEDEFREAVNKGGYTPDMIRQTTNAADYLMNRAHSVGFPFIQSNRDDMLAAIDELV